MDVLMCCQEESKHFSHSEISRWKETEACVCGKKEMEWRALMIQQVRNQNRPSLACLPLHLSLSPAFNRSGDNLVGLVGSRVVGGSLPRSRSLSSSREGVKSESEGVRETELELRVTTELPGNTVSNDNERKGRQVAMATSGAAF